MAANIKELQKRLIEALTPPLGEMGFAFKARTRSFYRDIPGGKQILHVTFIDHKEDFDATADVAVRIDALEDLVNEQNTRISAAEKALTATVGAELGNIAAGQPKRWTVESEADVPRAAAGILGDFRTIGLPYLERFSSLEAVQAALAGDDPPSRLHSPLHGPRAMRALGAAYLLGRRDDFNALRETKREYLSERRDFGLADFEAFAQKMESRPPS